MISTKSGNVKLVVLTPAMAYMLYNLEHFHRYKTVAQPDNLVITSINDGEHMKDSRHYTNEAIDVRTHNFLTTQMKQEFRREFEKFLGPKFRVILESLGTDNEHLHIQVRKGMEFP